MRNILIALLFSAQAFAQSFDFSCNATPNTVVIDGVVHVIEATIPAHLNNRGNSLLRSSEANFFGFLFGTVSGDYVPNGWGLLVHDIYYDLHELQSYTARSGSELVVRTNLAVPEGEEETEVHILRNTSLIETIVDD